MDKYVKLAKDAVEAFIKEDKKIKPPKDFDSKKAGVFVSIHKKSEASTPEAGKAKSRTVPLNAGPVRGGELRGCIGTILPTKDNLGKELIDNAISAATRDDRFSKVTKDELTDLKYKVDILSEPEPIQGLTALDPKKYGVIVKTEDGRTGLLLPDIPDIDTPEIQVATACEKAGISPAEKKYLYRFEVERHL